MLQLYYLYCKFKHVKAQVETPGGIMFKDHDRKPLDESELMSPDKLTNTEDEEAVVSPQENNMMEIIQEVDSSIDLNSSKQRSQIPSQTNDMFDLYPKQIASDHRPRNNTMLPPVEEASYLNPQFGLDDIRRAGTTREEML